MSTDYEDDFSFLEDLAGMTDHGAAGNAPHARAKATFGAEKLEERVLYSATWIDAEMDDIQDGTEDYSLDGNTLLGEQDSDAGNDPSQPFVVLDSNGQELSSESVGTYGFEDLKPGTTPTELDFGNGVTAEIEQSGIRSSQIIELDDGYGAVASEGENFWKIQGGETTLKFSEPLNQVSFNYSDVEWGNVAVVVNDTTIDLETDNSDRNDRITIEAEPGETIESITLVWRGGQTDGVGIDGIEVVSGSSDSLTMSENVTADSVVASIGGTNSGDVSYSLSGENSERFSIDEKGVIRVAEGAKFDVESEPNISVDVEITDGEGNSLQRRLAIVIEDTAHVEVEDVTGIEDQLIDLPINIDLDVEDRGEQIDSIVVSGLPEGATLTAGTDQGNGSWLLEPADLKGLQINPAENSHEDFELEVSVTTTKGVSHVSFADGIQSHAGYGQDKAGEFEVSDDGNELFITENGWKSVSGEFVVSENTVVEFEYKSTELPEFVSIGFDNDSTWNNGPSNADFFKIFGEQAHGDAADNAYEIYSGDGEYQTIRIPVGQYMSGEFDRMTFINDDDVANSAGVEGNSFFRNVRIFEEGAVETTTVQHTLSVTVDSVNDAVTDLDLSNSVVSENAAAGTVVGVLSATDADTNDTHSYDIVDRDGNVISDHNFEIVENEIRVKEGASLDYEQGDTHQLNIRVVDASGSERIEQFEIAIKNVNEGQVTSGESFTLSEDGQVSGNLLSNDMDLDGDKLQIESFEQPENGTVKVDSDGNFVFQPNENFSGQDSFSYTMTDGNGETSTQTVQIQVDAVADSASLTVEHASGSEDQSIALSIDASVVDASESIERVLISGVPEGASLSGGVDQGDGTWLLNSSELEGLSITPAENSHEDFELNVEVTTQDGDSVNSVKQSIQVQIDSVNDAVTDVVISGNQIAENSAAGTVVGTLTAYDADGDDTHVYEFVDANGNVVSDSNFEIVGSEIRVKEGAGLDHESSSSHQLNVRVTDSSGFERIENFEIRVEDINEGQVAFGETFRLDEDGQITGNVLANDLDLDGDMIRIEGFQQPEHGSVEVDVNGNFIYLPNENFSGTDSFTYTLTDGNGATSTQTAVLHVDAIADGVELIVENASGNEDQAIDLMIDASLLDIDGSEQIESVVVDGVPEGATLSAGQLQENGNWLLQPEELEGLKLEVAGLGNDDFELKVSVTASDGDATTVRSTIIKVDLQQDTLEAVMGIAETQLESQLSSPSETESNTAESPEEAFIARSEEGFDFESAYNQLSGMAQEVSDFNELDAWNQPAFQTEIEDVVNADGTKNSDGVQETTDRPELEIESIESLERQGLDRGELVEFDKMALHDFPIAVDGIDDDEINTAGLTAASLLLMFTKREDSRKKLKEINDERNQNN